MKPYNYSDDLAWPYDECLSFKGKLIFSTFSAIFVSNIKRDFNISIIRLR